MNPARFFLLLAAVGAACASGAQVPVFEKLWQDPVHEYAALDVITFDNGSSGEQYAILASFSAQANSSTGQGITANSFPLQAAGVTLCSTPLSIAPAAEQPLHIAPNPSSGTFTLQYANFSVAAFAAVYDAQGSL